MENENGLLGQDNFQYIIDITQAISGSTETQVRQPGYDVKVTQMTVDVIADGLSIPMNVATDLEKITIQIENVGVGNLFANAAMTLAQLAIIGQSDLFEPFDLKRDANLKITTVHTAKAGGTAYGTSLEIFIGLHGKKIS